jgi:hypothetical protein
MIKKWVCEFCGLQLQNVVPPVRHRCKSRGLGDTVAKVLTSVGVKKKEGCGCAERQAKLNSIFPYKKGAESSPDNPTPSDEM